MAELSEAELSEAELSERERGLWRQRRKLLEQRRFNAKVILGAIEIIMVCWGIILCIVAFPETTRPEDYSASAYIGLGSIATVIFLGLAAVLVTIGYEWYDDF